MLLPLSERARESIQAGGDQPVSLLSLEKSRSEFCGAHFWVHEGEEDYLRMGSIVSFT